MKLIDASFPPPPEDKESLAAAIAWLLDVLMWLVARVAALQAGEGVGDAGGGVSRAFPVELQEALRTTFTDRAAGEKAQTKDEPLRRQRAIPRTIVGEEEPQPGQSSAAPAIRPAPSPRWRPARAEQSPLSRSSRAVPATGHSTTATGPPQISQGMPQPLGTTISLRSRNV